MTVRSTALIAVAAFFCFACNNKSELPSTQQLDRTTTADQQLNSVADYPSADTSNQNQPIPGTDQKNQNDLPPKPVDWDKKIIKTAHLNAEVKDYQSFSNQLNEKVRKYGGYISQEEQLRSDYEIKSSIVIKVPVDEFENAVNDLTKDVLKLNEKHISSEDVTTQLVDGKSRLEAKKQVRLRYLDLLKQAKNMDEILTVQKEINDIQEEIEMVNGRINILNHSSAMSTIHLTFFQIIDPAAKNNTEKEAGFLNKLKAAFVNGWYWVGELFIGVISIWPLLMAIILGIWFFKKKQMPKIKQGSNPS